MGHTISQLKNTLQKFGRANSVKSYVHEFSGAILLRQRLINCLGLADKDNRRALVTVQKLLQIKRTAELEKAEALLMARMWLE